MHASEGTRRRWHKIRPWLGWGAHRQWTQKVACAYALDGRGVPWQNRRGRGQAVKAAKRQVVARGWESHSALGPPRPCHKNMGTCSKPVVWRWCVGGIKPASKAQLLSCTPGLPCFSPSKQTSTRVPITDKLGQSSSAHSPCTSMPANTLLAIQACIKVMHRATHQKVGQAPNRVLAKGKCDIFSTGAASDGFQTMGHLMPFRECVASTWLE